MEVTRSIGLAYSTGDVGLIPQFEEEDVPEGDDAAVEGGRKEVRLETEQQLV